MPPQEGLAVTGLDRRGFVTLGASGAFFVGLPLARAELKEIQVAAVRAKALPAPVDWAQFREEMKKRNQPGVIVLLQPLGQAEGKGGPREDAKRQFVNPQGANPLASAIHTSLFTCSAECELPLLLVQAVFVAMPADQARKEFPSLPADAGMALVGVDGKVVATLPADVDMGKKFAARAAELLHGKDSARLADRIKAERTALGDAACKQLDAAVVDLDDDAFDRRQLASETLSKLFAKVPASLSQAHRAAPSLEVRTRIDSLFRKKLHDENTAALLQRSLAPHVAAANFDIRIKCGQGALMPHAHAFVQLWCEAAGVQA